MGTELPWRWGRGTISANLDVIWGMSVKCAAPLSDVLLISPACLMRIYVSFRGVLKCDRLCRSQLRTAAVSLPSFNRISSITFQLSAICRLFASFRE